MAPSADVPMLDAPATEKTYPPANIFPVKETKFQAFAAPQSDGRRRALQQPGTAAIVIDNGSSTVKAGWSFESAPRLSLPPIMAKYRERKLARTFSFAGYDCYADANSRGHIRSAFEAGTGIVSNWDVMEHVLDHIFIKLGMNEAEGNIDVPIVMTEAPANLPYSRKCTSPAWPSAHSMLTL